jgi:hypothetical protein
LTHDETEEEKQIDESELLIVLSVKCEKLSWIVDVDFVGYELWI